MEAGHNVQTVARQQPTNRPRQRLSVLIGRPAVEFLGRRPSKVEISPGRERLCKCAWESALMFS